MNLWAGAMELLFPAKCPFCQRILEEPQAPLCPDCQPKLPWLTGRAGERKVDFTAGCCSPLAYREQVPEAVRRYKFVGVRAYGKPFAQLMAQCVRDHDLGPVDALTWAPLSQKRLRERGYDQARLLAEYVGKELSIPVCPTLVKTRHTAPQSELEGESARRANALNAYGLLPGAEVRGKRLLLVDDVVTSGATLSECARMLLLSGAESVWCVTLAQARTDEKSGKNDQKIKKKNG